MEELLEGLLEMGLGSEQPLASHDQQQEAEGAAVAMKQVLVVEQVKVIHSNGSLRVVFPSRVDLQSEVYRVERD